MPVFILQGLVEQQDEADNDGMMRSTRRAAGSSAGKAAAARVARLLHVVHPLEDVKQVARTYALCLQRLVQVGFRGCCTKHEVQSDNNDPHLPAECAGLSTDRVCTQLWPIVSLSRSMIASSSKVEQ